MDRGVVARQNDEKDGRTSDRSDRDERWTVASKESLSFPEGVKVSLLLLADRHHAPWKGRVRDARGRSHLS